MDKLALYVAAKYKSKKKLETGTVVYEYSERQVANRNKKKALRYENLRKRIKHLRAQVKRDLGSDDPVKALTALAVGLIDHTFERVGSPASAKGELNEDGEPHFGVTTWTKKHISFGKGGAKIKYVGKSGVDHTKKVTDANLVKALRRAVKCTAKDGDCIFKHEKGTVGGEQVNAYLKTFKVSAKDLRGFHANREMKERLAKIRSNGGSLPEDEKERTKKLKDEFKQALEETAKAVGHEASTLRTQYLIPGLEDNYVKDGSVTEKMGKQAALEPYEIAYPLAEGTVVPKQAGTITKQDVEKYRSDLRRMTKIYKSIPAAPEEKRLELFREAARIFGKFHDNWNDWVYRYLLPTIKKDPNVRGDSWYEKEIRTKAWDASMSVLPSTLFPTSWDYKTETHVDAPWQLAQDIDKKTKKYQREFNEVFKLIDEYLDTKPEAKIERPDTEQHAVSGMHVVIFGFGRDDSDYEAEVDKFIRRLGNFAARIEKAGLGDALHGLTVNVRFADPDKLGRPTDLTSGQYNAVTDSMDVYPLGFLQSDGGTFTHEVGHRYWFRELTPNGRAHWDEVMSSRTVVITREDVLEYIHDFLPKHRNLDTARELMVAIDREIDSPEKVAKWKELARSSRGLDWEKKSVEETEKWLLTNVGEKVLIEYISDYARESPIEAFAEAFKHYVIDGPGRLGPWTLWFFKEILRSGGAKFATYFRPEVHAP